MKKTILTYGLISGGVAAVMLLCMSLFLRGDTANFEYGELFGYAGILLSMLFVFLGVRAYRDQANGGVISFGKALQVGLLIAVISSVIYVIAWMIISNTLMTDFMEKYADYTLQKLRDSGASAETIAEQTKQMEYYKGVYKNPVMTAAFTFLEPFPIGLLVSLIAAGVLRRKQG